MPDDRCPRCGRNAGIEELGTTDASLWMHCGTCGHVWRATDANLDAFSLILASRAAVVVPMREGTRPDARPRAPRYQARLPLRYRVTSGATWYQGLTENLSRSGVLFQGDSAVSPRTAVDLILTLPEAVPGGPTSRVRCYGEVVRVVAPEPPHAPRAMAAAIGTYRLTVG